MAHKADQSPGSGFNGNFAPFKELHHPHRNAWSFTMPTVFTGRKTFVTAEPAPPSRQRVYARMT
jgi:hypothetical protein